MLINLTEAEVKFVTHAVQETAAKILSKLEAKPVTTITAAPIAGTVPAMEKPGRKPGKKPIVKIVEQAA